ncbi:MAG: PEP-CTERM sorting domain-containing protein [Proteobacteria bacterium]|nr:PEP-CTERM sorting domain-containing protein [Pseudomonadota bacterium]
MKRTPLKSTIVLGLLAALTQGARADAIPYPSAGTYNATAYTFTAAATGDVVAYFVGGAGAGYENQVGLMINGVLSSVGFGLDNHASGVGDSLDFGPANAGDTLTIVLHNLSLAQDAYSDPSLNVAYDAPGATGHNHVYSTAYTATAPVFAGVPAGHYVAFEDEPFPSSDYNYDDGSYVFTNVNVAAAVPEPATGALLLLGAVAVGASARRRRV